MNILNTLKSLIPNSRKVQYIYLVPSDKEDIATQVIQRAALHHQAWYQWQMGNGKTFTLSNPIVNTLLSSRPSSWFTDNPNGSDHMRFWDNTYQGVTEMVGSKPANINWMIYVDSQCLAGQSVGTIVGAGKSVMCSADILGLLGRNPDRTLCRQIGGDGHELGHGFGLHHHPVGEDPSQYNHAIMGTGYTRYPDCILRGPDKETLNASAWFAVDFTRSAPRGVCPFGVNINPSPSPRPIPPPRPRP